MASHCQSVGGPCEATCSEIVLANNPITRRSVVDFDCVATWQVLQKRIYGVDKQWHGIRRVQAREEVCLMALNTNIFERVSKVFARQHGFCRRRMGLPPVNFFEQWLFLDSPQKVLSRRASFALLFWIRLLGFQVLDDANDGIILNGCHFRGWFCRCTISHLLESSGW